MPNAAVAGLSRADANDIAARLIEKGISVEIVEVAPGEFSVRRVAEPGPAPSARTVGHRRSDPAAHVRAMRLRLSRKGKCCFSASARPFPSISTTPASGRASSCGRIPWTTRAWPAPSASGRPMTCLLRTFPRPAGQERPAEGAGGDGGDPEHPGTSARGDEAQAFARPRAPVAARGVPGSPGRG